MTDPAPTPPSNLKAEAKAAKAYYKASRPWYKKPLWIGLIALVAIIGISVAASGGGDDAKDTSASQSADPGTGAEKDKSDKAEEAEVPSNSTNGDGALAWGNWEVVGKIQISDDGLGDYAADLRVKNTSDAVDTGMFTVTVLKGETILGTIDCSTSEIGPGSVGTASCFSSDKYTKGWTELTIENMF